MLKLPLNKNRAVIACAGSGKTTYIVDESLKLTKRKNADWKMAEEITSNLKKFDPEDPIKYDFAICHIGIRKLKF